MRYGGLLPMAVRYCSILLCVLTLGCSDPEPPPLRVGVNPWVGYDPLVLSRELKLVDTTQLQIVELMSNTESIRALRNGLLDAAALTMDEALRLADEGVAVKIIALLDSSNGADAVMVRAGIHDLADLKGKRIALEKSALGALMLDRFLQAAGLRQEEVETLNVEAAEHVNVLENGRADAVVTFEPMKSRLAAKGFHNLFDSSRIPGEIVDTLVVREGTEPSREVVLIQAWQLGLRQLQADPQKAASLLAPSVELSSAEYLATLRGVHFISLRESVAKLDRSGAGLMRDADALTHQLRRLGLLHREPEWGALLDNRAARLVSEQP
ncbi:hypothetical protein Metme_1136 [Methylomonas methanica MC09]|uniref:NitT/TauT family transport system substrate-binding protein n=2 Tax=Methylomonas methanica TaxID=421 RepID=F9ZVU2_METMM|nr:hypothetical protein Metme_1136 [Methylomonas methanica MC09]